MTLDDLVKKLRDDKGSNGGYGVLESDLKKCANMFRDAIRLIILVNIHLRGTISEKSISLFLDLSGTYAVWTIFPKRSITSY